MITFKQIKPAPAHELNFPLLMRNCKTRQIGLFTSLKKYISLSIGPRDPEDAIGKHYIIEYAVDDWEVYHGAITLSNTDI